MRKIITRDASLSIIELIIGVNKIIKNITKKDGCWLMPGNPKNHAVVHIKEKTYPANRIIYRATHGKIKPGMYICHKCDIPKCVNPKHLFEGTHKDNLVDASKKGLMAWGERCGKAKISNKDAISIMKDHRSNKEIAKEYGITRTAVYMIRKKINWKHIKTKTTHPFGYCGSRIKQDDVIKIFHDKRKVNDIAKDYGLHRMTISRIKNHRTWRHVTKGLAKSNI